MNYRFIFTEELDQKQYVVTAPFTGHNIGNFITYVVKNHQQPVNKFMNYYGRAGLNVYKEDTGKLIATGMYSYNAFSGKANLKVNILK